MLDNPADESFRKPTHMEFRPKVSEPGRAVVEKTELPPFIVKDYGYDFFYFAKKGRQFSRLPLQNTNFPYELNSSLCGPTFRIAMSLKIMCENRVNTQVLNFA